MRDLGERIASEKVEPQRREGAKKQSQSNGQFKRIRIPSPIISHQSSIINHQSSIINHQSVFIAHPLAPQISPPTLRVHTLEGCQF